MAFTLSYDDFMHIGKEDYKQKKYQVALENFKNALDASNTPSLDVLEHLAATSEKLNQTEDALRWGKRMIQSHESNSRVGVRPTPVRSILTVTRDICVLAELCNWLPRMATRRKNWRYTIEGLAKYPKMMLSTR
jgi:tetratricopeptide (TPR) repeat protein